MAKSWIQRVCIHVHTAWDGRPFSLLCLRRKYRAAMNINMLKFSLFYGKEMCNGRSLTSNCQCAACSNCFACSLAQPAASTNWLIITCSRRVSIFFVTFYRKGSKYREKTETRDTRVRHSLSRHQVLNSARSFRLDASAANERQPDSCFEN